MVMLFCVLASVNSSGQSNDPPLMPVPNTPLPETEVKMQALHEQLTTLQNVMNDINITGYWTQEQMDRALYQEWEFRVALGESNPDGTPLDPPVGLSPNASHATANDVVTSPLPQ